MGNQKFTTVGKSTIDDTELTFSTPKIRDAELPVGNTKASLKEWEG